MRGLPFHSNEAFGEQLEMQEPDSYSNGVSKLLPQCGKSIVVLRALSCKIMTLQWNM
jgi:hypothetical protein